MMKAPDLFTEVIRLVCGPQDANALIPSLSFNLDIAVRNKLFDRFGNCALSQAKSVNQLMLFLYFFSS